MMLFYGKDYIKKPSQPKITNLTRKFVTEKSWYQSFDKYIFQIDSWWYYKGELQGVTNWTELPDIFPRGLDYVQQATGWPIAAHNRC